MRLRYRSFITCVHPLRDISLVQHLLSLQGEPLSLGIQLGEIVTVVVEEEFSQEDRK